MAKQVKLPFENQELILNLPDSWEIIAELKPNPMPKLDDIASSLRRALDDPIECEPMSSMNLSDKKIAIVVDDISRPTPTYRYFDVILNYLFEHGAKRENMLILLALGVHRAMTKEEVENKLGAKNIEGMRWLNHNFRDIAENAELGITKRGTHVALNKKLLDADVILCVGAIEPHLLLGFGGGLKMILPGLAYERTIAENHMQGVSPEKFNYIGARESPMRLDLEEAAQMLGKKIFIVNAIMNEKLEICRFVCGDPVKAHRTGVKIAESINAKKVDELADVVIAASNPMNADLRQGMKCIGNTEPSVKENGLIFALLECKYGIGDVAIPPKSLKHGLFRFILKTLGRNRILWFVDKVKKGAGVEERFLAHFSMQIVRKNEIFVYSNKLPADTGKKVGLFRQFTDLDGMIKAAAKYAPKKARVYIYPHGGVTYPVLKER